MPNKESLSSFIDDNGFRSASKSGVGETISSLAIFDVENGKKISTTALESLRSNPEILSASYLYEYKGGSFQGLTNDFIVKLKETSDYEKLLKLAEQHNCVVGKENEFEKNQFIVSISRESKLNAMQMANLFYETGLFEFAEPDFWHFNTKTSYDPYFINQWGLKNNRFNGGILGTDIQAVEAWDITTGRSNVKIAVVDDGIDLTHPDLQGNLLPGYDRTGQNSGGAPMHADDNHGTAVAGIIAALQNNRVAGSYEGISGVAPGCKIIPVRVQNGDQGPASWAADGINWAWQNGADVINLSWKVSPSDAIKKAIANAITSGRGGRGCIVVASSGNDNVNNVGGPVEFPACLSNVIAVGAMTRTGTRAGFSHYGAELDVVAPGDNGIYTTDRQDSLGYNDSSGTAGNYYPYFGGTSAAAPHVAGIAALVLSAHPPLTNYYIPELSHQQVKEIIIQSADRYPNRHNEYGYGLPNAYKAVTAAVDAFCSNLLISGPGSVVWNSNVSYSFPSLAPSVTFNGWTVTPSDYTTTGGMNSETLNISFQNSPQYTVKATFTKPDGSRFSTTKTVTNTRHISAPIIDWTYVTPDEGYPWAARAYVINTQTEATYEWRINNSGSQYSSPTTPTSFYLSGYADRFTVSCRARVGAAASDWSNTLTITAP